MHILFSVVSKLSGKLVSVLISTDILILGHNHNSVQSVRNMTGRAHLTGDLGLPMLLMNLRGGGEGRNQIMNQLDRYSFMSRAPRHYGKLNVM